MFTAISPDGRPAAPCAGPAVTTRTALAGAWSRFHAGFQAAAYTVTIRDPAGDRGFNVSRSAGLPDPIPADAVLDAILTEGFGALCRGWSPIARPRLDDRTIFQIDDISAETIAGMRADGWRPCYTQETSPGRCQAALATDALPDDLRRAVRPRLIRLHDGDIGATGAWRLPGFRNCKPHHRLPDGSYPRVRALTWPGEMCPRTAAFAAEVAADLAADRQAASATAAAETVETGSLDDLAWAWGRLRHHAVRVYGREWRSEHDWLMSLMLRHTGATADEVADALEALSPRHPGRGKGNEISYARAAAITAERAFGPDGDAALRDLSGYHWMWDRDLGDLS